MSPHAVDRDPSLAVTRPRPGHADLAGALKYDHRDVRNVLERASARETAARVAVGGLAKCLLAPFGIRAHGWVGEIGGDVANHGAAAAEQIAERADASVDIDTKDEAKAAIERSDVVAVPAAAVIAEAVAAFVVADAFLEKFGGDSLVEIRRNLDGYLEQVRRF